MRKIFAAGFIWILAAASMAQVDIQPVAFYADYASFESDSAGINSLEIYYQVYKRSK